MKVQSQSGVSGYAPTQGTGQTQALQQLISVMDTNKSASIKS
ncbi:MAG: hypothetical protein NTZ60_10105 [Campylobacterales bacterium]|nr:hypothetical protein [Campylobacterales bacterium]